MNFGGKILKISVLFVYLKKKYKMYRNSVLVAILFLIILVSVKTIFFQSPNKKVLTKLRLIEDEVFRKGYNPNWIIISGKRSQWYNDLLQHSVKNSHHIKGNAVDIYIFDIDCDGKFTELDIEILKSVNKKVEKNFPELKGFFGTYLDKGFLSKHMVHIDVRGYN